MRLKSRRVWQFSHDFEGYGRDCANNKGLRMRLKWFGCASGLTSAGRSSSVAGLQGWQPFPHLRACALPT